MTTDDRSEIETRVRSIWAKFAAQDPAGMLKLIHDDATIWDIFQPDLVTKRDMAAYIDRDFKQSAARGKLTYSMDNFVLSVWGDAAICRFYLSFDYEPPNPTKGTGRITCVLRKFPNDGWLVVHVHEG
ncbi:MAG: nuclear transport factor 2 family protein, partial [Alphaproteobacteria bacterium]|nr:nuclear transport factor 2 family protein [Alphaproteobacteria bacterium]